jgi:hypothetical protein
VRLQFPPTWKVHNVVNTSFVLPYRQSETFGQRQTAAPPPDVIDGEEHHHVAAFVQHRYFRNKYLQFLTEFTGQSKATKEWLFAEDLAEDLSPQYMSKLILSYRQAHQLAEPLPYQWHTRFEDKAKKRGGRV